MTNHPNRSKQQQDRDTRIVKALVREYEAKQRQAKHTPGPWVDMGLRGHPDGDNGQFHEIQFHTGTAEEGNRSFGHVCDVHVLAANEYARAIAKANARLIAAAPETAAERDRLTALNAELLAALSGLLETVEKHTTTNKSGFAANAVAWWKQQTRAAIAKAEQVR